MPYKNPRDLLLDATKFPAAVEAKLPEGAPKISTMLADATGKIPALPDWPMEIPNLPAPPALPELPALPTPPGGTELRRYVTGVEVAPTGLPTSRIPNATLHRGPPLEQAYTQPIEGVVGTVQVRRGM